VRVAGRVPGRTGLAPRYHRPAPPARHHLLCAHHTAPVPISHPSQPSRRIPLCIVWHLCLHHRMPASTRIANRTKSAPLTVYLLALPSSLISQHAQPARQPQASSSGMRTCPRDPEGCNGIEKVQRQEEARPSSCRSGVLEQVCQEKVGVDPRGINEPGVVDHRCNGLKILDNQNSHSQTRHASISEILPRAVHIYEGSG
jgi:hypothetical protein